MEAKGRNKKKTVPFTGSVGVPAVYNTGGQSFQKIERIRITLKFFLNF